MWRVYSVRWWESKATWSSSEEAETGVTNVGVQGKCINPDRSTDEKEHQTPFQKVVLRKMLGVKKTRGYRHG